MFITYLNTKFHIPSFNTSIASDAKENLHERKFRRTPCSCFTIFKKIALVFLEDILSYIISEPYIMCRF